MPKRKTNEQFEKEFYNLVGDEYLLLSDYKTSKDKILIKHNKCGYTYKVTPDSFINLKRRCPKCAGNIKKSTEKFKEEINKKFKGEYVIEGDYINNKTKISVRHIKCNNIWNIKPNDLLQGFGCPYCYGSSKKTTEQFKKEVYDLVGDEYEVLSNYKSCNEKIKFKHNICNKTFNMRSTDFLSNGHRCPYCKRSIAEEKISKYLEEKLINYKTQVTIDGCKYKRLLKFDFQILLNNNSNIIFIEYDGEQHFKPIFYKNNFIEQQKRDKIKDDYCKEQGIHLYRIPYTEYDNIESILDFIIEKETKII